LLEQGDPGGFGFGLICMATVLSRGLQQRLHQLQSQSQHNNPKFTTLNWLMGVRPSRLPLK
jgi:hypothetical protein